MMKIKSLKNLVARNQRKMQNMGIIMVTGIVIHMDMEMAKTEKNLDMNSKTINMVTNMNINMTMKRNQ